MTAGVRSAGWLRVSNGANPESLGVFTLPPDPATPLPAYAFGTGIETGRVSTETRAGSAITVPDAYSFGEMWELRYTFAETGNSQRQGIFMDVRTSAANSSTVRGVEVTAQSEGNINVGTLSGGTFKGIPRGTTGTITNLFGVEGEITFNDSAFTGTVTLGAAGRFKVSLEDGATYTAVYGVYVDGEAITGGDVGTALFAASTTGLTWTSGIDIAGAELVETDTGTKVTLIRFQAADGAVYLVQHDTDAATVLSVAAE